MRAPGLASHAPIVILDTNALLDWRVFKDPAARPLAQALLDGRLRWLASPAMLTEWNHVWPRSVFARWQPDAALTTTVFEHAIMVDEPPRGPLVCKDPDDQVFIDLAVQVGAQWLFSKDAALLKLARRARLHGVEVMALQQWAGLPEVVDA
ncbi:MAG: PIN domain-containing protein [Burkholderiales bacterium]|nr:PIN domain-containing protein [Burkholderiales bacterium]